MAGPQTINIMQLNVMQLTQLKQQIDEEVEFFSSSLQQLKLAQGKFQGSQENLKQFTSDPSCNATQHELLIPLSTSGVEAAREYFQRKVQYLTKQIEKVQELAQEKVKIREVVMEALESKVSAHLASQQKQTPAPVSS
ncbi:unnamed protein product [Darwinula stevensoni]|uniref:Prefoldin subunit 5 n=1 Tax=Darwinula stevensoni TaxID=69355 RepID=A0A7R8X8C2_9CRUS|nr:unnamed protein product [Darwinula stevensoni]CAG0887787.1 unnamed protein product [Darwinula stevensoni]